jgi:diacylglycerol O-acyltransferase / trehalose O-mycolyltransferase
VVPLPEGVSVPDSTVRVVLPEGYADSGLAYPVVYVLHGVGDSYSSWTELTDLIEFSRDLEVILVMPDGGSGSEAGWYSDWEDGSRQWETFHTQVLVEFIDSTYRTLGTGHRGVLGLSMGGFGAMKYAARHPGLFDAAASFSGAVDTMFVAPVSGIGFATASDAFGTPDERVWGDQITDEETWRDHNPTDRAPDLAGVRLFVATGTGTPGGHAGDDLSNPASYTLETFILLMNTSFSLALTEADVEFDENFYVGGYHGWPYWQAELHRVLPLMLADLGPPQPVAVPAAPSEEPQPVDDMALPVSEVDPSLPATGADIWLLGLVVAGIALLARRWSTATGR